MSHSRISGIIVSGFGLLLFFFIIPYDTETVDYGWMRPQTLPNILAWVLCASGIIIALQKGDDKDQNLPQTAKALAYLAILVAGIFITYLSGFVMASPILALALMWIIGERRLKWLLFGVVGIPFLIWLVVVVILGRLLP